MSTKKHRKKLEPLSIDRASTQDYPVNTSNSAQQIDLENSLKGSVDNNISFPEQNKEALLEHLIPPILDTYSQSPSTSTFQQEIEIMKKKLAQMSDEELFTNVHKLYEIVIKYNLNTYDEE